ncbi:MAG TPA: alkaline phosphatase family protein [Bryobacteraceae bacterium]|nr:alkaline phosphatase family protein [Bryobacteraceae bacterium]
MKQCRVLICSFFLASITVWAAPPAQPVPKRPKLVLGIVIDQFRYDYLTRFRKDYTGGFVRLLENGAVFTNAHQAHVPTVTAVGHSTFLTGATPALSGIVANDWYDRETGKTVTSVSDDTTELLGAPGKGSSPRRLLVSTLGDELKISGKGGKVIGISIKDRSAILPSGHMADGAYWFDAGTGDFVSSTYYFAQLPEWAAEFNKSRRADAYSGVSWKSIIPPAIVFRTMGTAQNAKFYGSLESSPYGNELIEQFAERAIAAEGLGRHDGIDLLTVSFSANDYVGHALGPDSPEVRDMSVRTDRLLGKLFAYLDARLGPGNVLMVLTADHGVAPIPEVNEKRKMPGGRINARSIVKAAEDALDQKYGAGHWILSTSEAGMYLNHQLIAEKKLQLEDVQETAARAIRRIPHIFRVYTAEQLFQGEVQADTVGTRTERGYNAGRSGDLIVIQDPYWLIGGNSGTSHSTPFDYDSHVPLVFCGAGVKPGRYYATAAVNDVAPTLATMLDVEIPSGSVGRVLSEILGH